MKNPYMYERKDSNGKTIYYIAYTDDNGKLIRKTTKSKEFPNGCRNKSDANKFLNSFNKDTVDTSDISFKKLSELVLLHVSNNAAPATYMQYRTSFRAFLKIFPDIKAMDVTINHIEKFKQTNINLHEPVTINGYLTMIKAGYNKAIRLKLVKKNPFSNFEMLNVEKKLKTVFSNEEISQVLSVAKKYELYELIYFAYLTGCRIGEIINLEWSDIDFMQNIIKIQGKYNFKIKNRTDSEIPMNTQLINFLSKLKRKSNYVFVYGANNKKWKRTSDVSHKMKNLIRELHIDTNLTFHKLRHTFINKLVQNNVNAFLVQRLARHRSIKTTLGYTDIVTNDLRNAMESVSLGVK